MTLEMAQKILEPFLMKDEQLVVTLMGGGTPTIYACYSSTCRMG